MVENVNTKECEVYIDGNFHGYYYDLYNAAQTQRDNAMKEKDMKAEETCSTNLIEEERDGDSQVHDILQIKGFSSSQKEVELAEVETLCIFTRAINIKNIKIAKIADDRVQLPPSGITIAPNDAGVFQIHVKHIDLLGNYVDLARSTYDIHIISTKYSHAGACIPLVMNEIENLMIAQDCIDDLLPTFPDVLGVRAALSTPNSLVVNNYERLEILGDSVLKLLTSLHLMMRHPAYHEGQLTKVSFSFILTLYFFLNLRFQWCSCINHCLRAFLLKHFFFSLRQGLLVTLRSSLLQIL